MAILLGGEFAPVGNAVGFIQAPIESVVRAEEEWRNRLGTRFQTSPAGCLPLALDTLQPLQTPWTRQLFVSAGPWTCYLNNDRNGGDPVPSVGVLTKRLSCTGVVAVCSERPPHSSTQFQLLGPSGTPPLNYVRTLAADCADGKWQWIANGQVQAFEDEDRYESDRIRDRLDRRLLVDYLLALGIPIDDPESFGDAIAIHLAR